MVQREAGWGRFPVKILLLLNTWDSPEPFFFFSPLNTHVEPHARCRTRFPWTLKGTSGRKAASRTCSGGSWETSWYLWGRRNKSLKGVWSERTWKLTMTFFFLVCPGLQGSTHLGLIPLLFRSKMESLYLPLSLSSAEFQNIAFWSQRTFYTFSHSVRGESLSISLIFKLQLTILQRSGMACQDRDDHAFIKIWGRGTKENEWGLMRVTEVGSAWHGCKEVSSNNAELFMVKTGNCHTCGSFPVRPALSSNADVKFCKT